MCPRQGRAVHLGEMGRKRSAMVPVVKDVVGIIFPESPESIRWFLEVSASPVIL